MKRGSKMKEVDYIYGNQCKSLQLEDSRQFMAFSSVSSNAWLEVNLKRSSGLVIAEACEQMFN